MLRGITSEKMDLHHHDVASNDAECMRGFSSDVDANSLGQEMQPNMSRTNQEEMLGSQPSGQLVYQQHQQELHDHHKKNKVLSTHSCSLQAQLNIINSDHQLQQQTTSLSNKPSYSQQLVLPVQPYCQPFGQSTSTVSQQDCRGMEPDDAPEQQKVVQCQKKMPIPSLHPFGQQADVSGVHLPKVIGPKSNVFNEHLRPKSNVFNEHLRPKSNVFNEHLHQPTQGVLGQSVAMVPEQKIRNATQPVQFHEILSPKKQQGLSPDSMQQHLQMSAVPNQHQSIPGSAVDQQKLFHSQSLFSGTSSDSSVSMESTPDELARTADWHDQAYQRILEVKLKFGPMLQFLHKLFTSFCNKPASAEEIQGYKAKLRAIEKQLMFLSLQRFQITNFSKERVACYLEFIIKFVTCFQKNSLVSAERNAHQQPGTQSQSSQKPQNLNVRQQSYPVSLALTNSMGSSSPGSIMQHGPPTSLPKNLFSPLQCSSQIGLEQRDELSPLQRSANYEGENNLGGQWNKLSGDTVVNVYDSEPKHPTMLPQELKQHMQLHDMQQKKKHMLMSHFEPGVTLDIKCLGNLNQSLLLKNCHPCASSQNSQHSSPQIDWLTSLQHPPKAESSLQPANSPSVRASSSPMTPSSVPTDYESHKSIVASKSEKKGCLKALAGSDTQSQVQPLSPAMWTSDILASPLITVSTTHDGNQQSADAMQPLERLLKAVKSSSQKALSASVHEIELVVNEKDTFAGATNTDSMLAVGEDLASTTRCRLQALNFGSQDAGFHMRGTKCQISALASSNMLQLDLTATPENKRQRTESSNDLFDEIRYIYQQLLETVVEFNSTKDVAITGGNEGVIVRCSFSAVAFSENFKAYASTLMLPVLSIWLLVPASYPNSSPKVLEGSFLGCSLGNKESEDLSGKAKLRFSTSLRKLSEPMSLGEMAKTWNVCARAAVFEQAQLIGGECFSSRYGSWENIMGA